MQPSIKMFFKAKETPTKRTNEEGSKDASSQDGDENDEKKSRSSQVKRHAEEDEDISINKRQAMSSPKTSDLSKASDTNKINEDKTISPPPSTPSKKLQLIAENKPTVFPSPLMDTGALIKKKISSGAFALHENIGVTWFKALQGEFDKPYFKKLSEFVKQERNSKVVYPPHDKVFSWTHHHEIRDTKVIIIGQDPYHGPNQAHGLSFSVQRGIRLPPSLINIFKELENDISGFRTPNFGDLTGWAKQGVLMLNTCLTVNQGQANSHQNKGWETFTDAVISWISKNARNNIVFLLWGRPAQKKSGMIDKRHKVLTAAHPSPLSAHNGFFGCRHFSQTNAYQKSQGLPEIDWKAL